MSNISDEPLDSEQLVDPGIVGAVTRDDWILVLEREAPQADLNTNNGFDVRAVTLRTASGRTLTSYGLCVLKLQVPPIEDAARVTFQVVGCAPSDSVSGDVGGQWLQSATSRPRSCVEHRRRSLRAVDAYSWFVVFAGVDHQQQRFFAGRQRCGIACMPASLGSSHESRERAVSIVDQDDGTWGCATGGGEWQ